METVRVEEEEQQQLQEEEEEQQVQEEEEEEQFGLMIQLFDCLWFERQVLSSQPHNIISQRSSTTVTQDKQEESQPHLHLPRVKSDHQSKDFFRVPSPKSLLETVTKEGDLSSSMTTNQAGDVISVRQEEAGVESEDQQMISTNSLKMRRKSANKGRIQKRRSLRRSTPQQQAALQLLSSTSSSDRMMMTKRRSLSSELEGFMDLGFPRPVWYTPAGLQRLDVGETEEIIPSRRELLGEIDTTSNNWSLPENKWRLPSLRNEVDMKKHIRMWAHTVVASAVR